MRALGIDGISLECVVVFLCVGAYVFCGRTQGPPITDVFFFFPLCMKTLPIDFAQYAFSVCQHHI